MKLRRTPTLCEVPRCGRLAILHLSNGPDLALSCGAHLTRWERLWGQVFIRPIATRHLRGRSR